MGGWTEIADGVLVQRHHELDLSTGLILGDTHALVVDTGGDEEQGAELVSSIRGVTGLPWRVVITHGHFDHCFGTRAFQPAPVWAHERCASRLTRTAESQRTEWMRHYRDQGRPDVADALATTRLVTPDRLVTEDVFLELGGREVQLIHLGYGHTDHDLVVFVPDVSTIFAGDLVENGESPSFEDSWPTCWPSTMESLLQSRPELVIPGHGNPVGTDFVQRQQQELVSIANLCLAYHRGSIPQTEALRQSPYPEKTTRIALTRPALPPSSLPLSSAQGT